MRLDRGDLLSSRVHKCWSGSGRRRARRRGSTRGRRALHRGSSRRRPGSTRGRLPGRARRRSGRPRPQHVGAAASCEQRRQTAAKTWLSSRHLCLLHYVSMFYIVCERDWEETNTQTESNLSKSVAAQCGSCFAKLRFRGCQNDEPSRGRSYNAVQCVCVCVCVWRVCVRVCVRVRQQISATLTGAVRARAPRAHQSPGSAHRQPRHLLVVIICRQNSSFTSHHFSSEHRIRNKHKRDFQLNVPSWLNVYVALRPFLTILFLCLTKRTQMECFHTSFCQTQVQEYFHHSYRAPHVLRVRAKTHKREPRH